MLTVACVLRSGGVYTLEYVRRLAAGVEGHLSLPYRFVCLSDDRRVASLGAVAHVPLATGWPGWLAKLELFRPDLFSPGEQVLYLDLDTIVVGSIDAIAAHPHRFSMLSDFYRPQLAASGVMAWSGGRHQVFTEFRAELIPLYARWHPVNRGDCGWIEGRLGEPADRLQDMFPGQLVSRKVPEMRNPNERLVCYHGVPRPHETGWAA